MMSVERLAIQVLIARIANRDRGARQHVFNALVQSSLFIFGRVQHRFDRVHNGFDALAVRVLIAFGRTDLELVAAKMIASKIARACS